MRSASIAAVLGLAPWALCVGHQQQSQQQQPLHAVTSASADAPAYRDQLLHLHRSLVSIESISGNEEAAGRFLVDYLAERGYSVDRQAVAPRSDTPEGKQRFNVLAWRGGGRPDPKVVVSSHMDVVPPYIPYGIPDAEVTRHTVITGRGSVDAKGSIACMIVALDRLLASAAAAPEDVMLLFVVGEEVAGDGMRVFSNELDSLLPPPRRLAAVIFGEPTENKLACGHKGALFCQVTAQGVGGHSGYPWLGKSANELMVRAMAEVLNTHLGSSELFGNTTVNIGRFDGGVAANVIPEHALVKLGVRVATGSEAEGAKVVQRRIQAILDGLDDEAFAFECSHGYGPVVCNCDVPGFNPVVVNYGTDIGNLKGNHTRYLYGPGTILVAHGAHENLTVGDLETAVGGYQKLILHALRR